jgi:3-hydroxybutyryl-CoA dehydratase
MTTTTTLETVRREVDNQTILDYADLTNDYNPIHVDAEFAKKTAFGGQIAHGTMSVALIWQSLARTLGQARIAGIQLEIRFAKPVRIGDEVRGGGELTDAEGGKTYTVWVKNQKDEVLISGTAVLDALGSSAAHA